MIQFFFGESSFGFVTLRISQTFVGASILVDFCPVASTSLAMSLGVHQASQVHVSGLPIKEKKPALYLANACAIVDSVNACIKTLVS